ncbi:mucin-binding protein [Lacticaseibacillus suihuaensis]
MKVSQIKSQTTEVTEHIKLYKAGKRWLTAGIFVAALGVYGATATPVQAAAGTDAATTATGDSITSHHAAILKSSQTAAPTKAATATDPTPTTATTAPTTGSAKTATATGDAAATGTAATGTAAATANRAIAAGNQAAPVSRRATSPAAAASTTAARAAAAGASSASTTAAASTAATATAAAPTATAPATTDTATDATASSVDGKTTAVFDYVDEAGAPVTGDRVLTVSAAKLGVVPGAATVAGYTLEREVVNIPVSEQPNKQTHSVVVDYGKQTYTEYTGDNGTGSVVEQQDFTALNAAARLALANNGVMIDPSHDFDMQVDTQADGSTAATKDAAVADWWQAFVLGGGSSAYVYSKNTQDTTPEADRIRTTFHYVTDQGETLSNGRILTVDAQALGVVPGATVVPGYTLQQEVIDTPAASGSTDAVQSIVVDYANQTYTEYAGLHGTGAVQAQTKFADINQAERLGDAYQGIMIDPTQDFDMGADAVGTFYNAANKLSYINQVWRLIQSEGLTFSYVYSKNATDTTPQSDVVTTAFNFQDAAGNQLAPATTVTVTDQNLGVVPGAATIAGYTVQKEVVNLDPQTYDEGTVQSIVIDYASQTYTQYTGRDGSGAVEKQLSFGAITAAQRVAIAYQGLMIDPTQDFDMEKDRIAQFVSLNARQLTMHDTWAEMVAQHFSFTYVYAEGDLPLSTTPVTDPDATQATFNFTDDAGTTIADPVTISVTQANLGTVPAAATVAGYVVQQEVVNLPPIKDAAGTAQSVVVDYVAQTLTAFAGRDGSGAALKTTAFADLDGDLRMSLGFNGIMIDPTLPLDMETAGTAHFASATVKHDSVSAWWHEVIAGGATYTYVYKTAATATQPAAQHLSADFTYVDANGQTLAPTQVLAVSETALGTVPGAATIAGYTLQKEVVNTPAIVDPAGTAQSIVVDYAKQVISAYSDRDGQGTLMKATAFTNLTATDRTAFAFNGILIDPSQGFDMAQDTAGQFPGGKLAAVYSWWQTFLDGNGTHSYVYVLDTEAGTGDLVTGDKVRATFSYVDENGKQIAADRAFTTTELVAGTVPGAAKVAGYTLQKEVVNTPAIVDPAGTALSIVVDYTTQRVTAYTGRDGQGIALKTSTFAAMSTDDRIGLAYDGIMIDAGQDFDLNTDTVGQFASVQSKLDQVFTWWQEFVVNDGSHTYVYSQNAPVHGTATSTRTIVFVDDNGKQLAAPIVQTVTYRTSTNGEGTTVYTAQGVYAPESSPTIAGYTPDQTTIAAAYPGAGLGQPQNTTVTVTYTRDHGNAAGGVRVRTQVTGGVSVTPADYYDNTTAAPALDAGVRVRAQVPAGVSVTPADYYDNTEAVPALDAGVRVRAQVPAGVSVTPADYYDNTTEAPALDAGVRVRAQVPAGLSVSAEDFYDYTKPGRVDGGVAVRTQVPAGLSVTKADYYDHTTPQPALDAGVRVRTQVTGGLSVTPAAYYAARQQGMVAGGVIHETAVPTPVSVTKAAYYDHRTPTGDTTPTTGTTSDGGTTGTTSTTGTATPTGTQTPAQPTNLPVTGGNTGRLVATTGTSTAQTPALLPVTGGATPAAQLAADHAASGQLPQTGEAPHAALTAAGLGLLALLGLAGVGSRKDRRED